MRRAVIFALIGSALAIVVVGVREHNLGAAGLALAGIAFLASSLGPT